MYDAQRILRPSFKKRNTQTKISPAAERAPSQIYSKRLTGYWSVNSSAKKTHILTRWLFATQLVMSYSMPLDFKSLHTVLLLDGLSYLDGIWNWSYELSSGKSWARNFPDGMHWIYSYRETKDYWLLKIQLPITCTELLSYFACYTSLDPSTKGKKRLLGVWSMTSVQCWQW